MASDAMAQAEMSAQREYYHDEFEEGNYLASYQDDLTDQQREDRRLAHWSEDYDRRKRWLETTNIPR